MSDAALGQLTPQFLEKQLGDDTGPKLEELHGGRLENQKIIDYVNEVGQKILPYSTRKDWPHAFIPLKSEEIVNAYAIGNGNAYVTMGLLNLLDDEAELAFVLAHEMGHVDHRHIAHSLDSALGVTLLLELAEGMVGAGAPPKAFDSAKGVVSGLVLNGFSRTQELDADEQGVKYLARAGYDPLAPIRVFEKFQKMAAEVKGLEIYFQSHPTAKTRIEDAKKEIDKKFPGLTGETFKERYQEIVKGVRTPAAPMDIGSLSTIAYMSGLMLLGAFGLWAIFSAATPSGEPQKHEAAA